MLHLTNYADSTEQTEKKVVLPPNITAMGITYDGGRFSISVNGQQLFSTMNAGIDFAVEIDNKPSVAKTTKG